MSEQNTSKNQETLPLKQALDELLRAGFGSYELEQAEVQKIQQSSDKQTPESS